ncbi:DUF3888 domain-containing protein [Niallia taxi]|uniref:DUF3888 domain-containing protein n=1 Tax=Niallia taxi TaxID=2499688 RepID=UPI002E1AD49A|nr:DUF3888 domain-containing protein [Niallia taxi]
MTYKRKLLLLITFLTLFSYSSVRAETLTKNDVQLRDDVILDLLFPAISNTLDKHFGKPKQFYCDKILQIKKKEEQKNYTYYNVTVQMKTFEGAHDYPYDLVTITFSNKCSTEWKAIDIKSRPLKPDEISCQDY